MLGGCVRRGGCGDDSRRQVVVCTRPTPAPTPVTRLAAAVNPLDHTPQAPRPSTRDAASRERVARRGSAHNGHYARRPAAPGSRRLRAQAPRPRLARHNRGLCLLAHEPPLSPDPPPQTAAGLARLSRRLTNSPRPPPTRDHRRRSRPCERAESDVARPGPSSLGACSRQGEQRGGRPRGLAFGSEPELLPLSPSAGKTASSGKCRHRLDASSRRSDGAGALLI
jgi:hypothetical protein